MLRRLFESWFRRRVTQNKQEALRTRQRLALVYAFLGWHCFGLIFFVIMKKETPDDPDERRSSYRMLTGVPSNMHVYQVSGTTLTNEFDIVYKAKVDQIDKENKENKNVETNV